MKKRKGRRCSLMLMNERRGAFPSGLQFTLRNKQLSFTNVNMSAHSDMRKTSGSDLELQHRSRKVVRKHFKPRLTSDDCVINAEAWPGGGQRAQQNSYKSIAEMLQTEEVMTHRQTFREMWETEYVPEDPGGAGLLLLHTGRSQGWMFWVVNVNTTVYTTFVD